MIKLCLGCGHCKRLAPTFEKLATTVKGQVNVAKVDCTVHKNICNRYGVMGYPTVYLQQDGQIYEYNGDRSENDFVTFLNGGYKAATASPVPAPGSNRRGDKYVNNTMLL
jgi:thioredoxin-like negative regulator of GroEL